MTDEQPVQVRHTQLELRSAQATLKKSTQDAIDVVAARLRGLDTGDGPRTPGAAMQVSPAANMRASKDDLRAKIIGDGLQACANAMGPALVWAHQECRLWSLPGQATKIANDQYRLVVETTDTEWNRLVVEDRARFERLGNPAKLERLGELGLGGPTHAEDLLSLNRLRNCLVHRAGVVRGEDIPAGDEELHVRWSFIAPMLTGEHGKRRAVSGMVTLEDMVFSAEVVTEARSFAEGEHVRLSLDEFVEMTGAYLLFANELGPELKMVACRRYEEQQAGA